jgi:hypothetical protein
VEAAQQKNIWMWARIVPPHAKNYHHQDEPPNQQEPGPGREGTSRTKAAKDSPTDGNDDHSHFQQEASARGIDEGTPKGLVDTGRYRCCHNRSYEDGRHRSHRGDPLCFVRKLKLISVVAYLAGQPLARHRTGRGRLDGLRMVWGNHEDLAAAWTLDPLAGQLILGPSLFVTIRAVDSGSHRCTSLWVVLRIPPDSLAVKWMLMTNAEREGPPA